MVLYCDADFAGDTKDSKSTSGAIVALIGPNSYVPVSAWCKKQGAVSHSSTEAEIVSLDTALHQEGLPVLTLWEEMSSLFGPTREGTHGKAGSTAKPLVPFIVAEDNEAAITLARKMALPNDETYLAHTLRSYG